MALTAEQIERRKFGIGGSECAMALGLSKRKTALELYLEKRGEVVPEFEETEEQWWGRMLEPIVRQKYAERTGRVVRLPEDTLRHPEHEFMLAHVDGVTDDGRGYEGKTAFHSIGWGEEGTDEIPIDYLMQTQHYMVVTGLPVFDVASLIGRRFALYEVKADAELQQMIIEGERDFIRRVREGDPPPIDFEHPTAIEVVKKLYPGTNGARVTASLDAVEWRAQMEAAAEIEKAQKFLKDSMKARLLNEMGEAAMLVFPDGKAMRRKLIEKEPYQVAASSYMDSRFVKA